MKNNNLPTWVRWSECHAVAQRNGEEEACDKPAIAVALDEEEPGHQYPVCKHHARGRPLLSLTDVVAAVIELSTNSLADYFGELASELDALRRPAEITHTYRTAAQLARDWKLRPRRVTR